MKPKPSMVVLRSLLFVFDIENTKSEAREEIITSKNVNDDCELAELFDLLLRSDFLKYRPDERQWFVDTILYFLDLGDNFDEVFTRIDTYFDSEVEDQRRFMKVLLERLRFYQSGNNGA
ncbi:hypothetical protein [Pseudomonas sp. F01002]|uniref:hypothetical protein n=1 Tax=Pseudomonas sp. F01002 TaxID=2555724 RepID=UPI00106C1F09|nr:hypothetical protein [Pseudomonas sp. F01002]TFB41687.1 hypothetical protein E3W21_11110 [Pseudomonas sp. F01002]